MNDLRFNFLRSVCLNALALALLLSSCKRELGAPNVESELLTPIISTKLTIHEIVPDSIHSTDNDGFVTLTYRNQVYSSELSSFQELETREFEEVAKLQSLTLDAKSAERSISLGQVALAEGGVTGQFIINAHGSNSAIPPINGLTYGPIPVDGSAFFESVTLDSGYMDITLNNGFPTGLSDIDFEIRNESDNSLVGAENFANVTAGGTETRTIDLAGKTIEGALLGNILNMDIDGTSSPVPIDTSDAVNVTITVRDMKVNSATAIFPAQNIIEIGDTSAMRNVEDLRLTKAKASTGTITIRVVSTVEDTMYFDYFVPGGIKDGSPLEINEKVDPAPVGGSIEKTFSYAVDGYVFDLTGAPKIDLYNSFYSELTGRIDSTGKVVNLSLNDSILVYVKLSAFVPEYIEGYLGNTELVVGPESAPVSLFKHFDSGILEFEEVNVSLGVSNGNGVPFEVEFQELSAENTKTSNVVDIDLSSLPDPIQIERALDLDNPWEELWQLEASTNLNQALNIYPDRLNVGLRVASNPQQNASDLTQFADQSKFLEAFLDIDIPLSFIAQDLVLKDTVSFDAASIKDLDQISGGTFYLLALNSLPLDAEVGLLFLDPTGEPLIEVAFDGIINGATSDEQSVLSWEFNAETFSELSTADRVVLSATVNTVSSSSPQKIFSDQSLDVTITGRFKYQSAP